jgi:hypothetical protein
MFGISHSQVNFVKQFSNRHLHAFLQSTSSSSPLPCVFGPPLLWPSLLFQPLRVSPLRLWYQPLFVPIITDLEASNVCFKLVSSFCCTSSARSNMLWISASCLVWTSSRRFCSATCFRFSSSWRWAWVSASSLRAVFWRHMDNYMKRINQRISKSSFRVCFSHSS